MSIYKFFSYLLALWVMILLINLISFWPDVLNPLVIVSFLFVFALAFLTIGMASKIGDPKEKMPPKHSPLRVKMIHIENNFCYMTITPYSDVSSGQYYMIPEKKIENLGSIETGTVIINDNGVLKPLLTALEV